MFRLRLLRLILLWWFRPALDLLGTHELRLRAWPIIDVDVTRMMAHAFTRAMALGRYQLVFGSEFRHFAFKRRWYPVTVAEIFAIHRSIRIFERFTVRSRIICWDERRFYAEQTFHVGSELRARGIVEGVIWGPGGHLKPAEVFSELGIERASPPLSDEILAWKKNRFEFS